MPLFGNDPVKLAVYELAAASLQKKLNDESINRQLKRHVETIFEQVKKAKASRSSGLSTDQLTQILKVSEQAMVTDNAMGMDTDLINALSVHPCLKLVGQLQNIKTVESNRLMGLMFCLAGLILILASVALAVFTAGIASPLSFIGISLGVSILISGVLGLMGMAVGVKKKTESGADLNHSRMELDKQVDEIYMQTKQRPLDQLKEHFITKFNQGYFELAGKSEDDVKKLQSLMVKVNNGDFSRLFDLIKSDIKIDKTAYESIVHASKTGTIKEHLTTVAKSLSTLFLDENIRLKKDFVDVLGKQGLWGCSIAMNQVPSMDVADIPLGPFNSGYIRVKNERTGLNQLFYINKLTKERSQLNITDTKLKEYDSRITSSVEPVPLLAKDLDAIESTTGHNASLSQENEDKIITGLLQATITLYTGICTAGFNCVEHAPSDTLHNFTWGTIKIADEFNKLLKIKTIFPAPTLLTPKSMCLSGISLQDARKSIQDYMLQTESLFNRQSPEEKAICEQLKKFNEYIEKLDHISNEILSEIPMTQEQQTEVEDIWQTVLLNHINTICNYLLKLPNIESCFDEKDKTNIQDILNRSCNQAETIAPNFQFKKMDELTTIPEDDEEEGEGEHPHP